VLDEVRALLDKYEQGQITADEIVRREVLDPETRACVSLVALAALGQRDEFEAQAQAALAGGLPRASLAEALLELADHGACPQWALKFTSGAN
jgi:alkylhydroperoxidase/carboxymuconolactone decarboxylase family protein YurZ